MKKESTFRKIRKRLKPKMILLLALTLAINSFAWFIYSNKVDSGVSAKVKAWNILFEVGDGEQVQQINFDVDDMYPGMTTYTRSVTVNNRGDTAATLSFEVISANIFGDVITASEQGAVTPAMLLNSLRTDYPFVINPSVSSSVLLPGDSETFTITVTWPYESGDDAEDTHWGGEAFDYAQTNPDDPSIIITLKIIAIQTAAPVVPTP